MDILLLVVIIVQIIIIICLSISCIHSFIKARKNLNEQIDIEYRLKLLEKYAILIDIFQQSVALSYEKVWKEDILVYLSSGYVLSEKEVQEFGKKFISYTFKCCGWRILSDLELIYGDLTPVIHYLLSIFLSKVSDDETILRKSLSEKGEDEINAV